MKAWRAWYHCTGNTYGTWLPGDPRGWKTRHHRTHVDTPAPDSPPSPLVNQSRDLLTCPPVKLSEPARRVALDIILAALWFHRIETIVAAVGEHHFHILARFRDGKPKKWIGIAKKESALAISEQGLAPPGGVWAIGSHAEPIADREHQLTAAQYIADHEKEGAIVWAIWRAKPRRQPEA